ncbi:hypothetical protein WJX72_009709 [[Myrmecia] bisecta]|uniref:UmuC domain-containing protein n=1 Tax=[Myrmecia] bisecta TaxID=41462 RepID=A0AAW1R8H8_9CHLO
MEAIQAQRVVAHVDLDAFYAQVEMKRDPQLQGRPVGVVQYNPYGDLKTIGPDEPRIFNDSNGSLIAVSYEARAFGVKRNMRGDVARQACPELQLVQVPTAHGKADLTLYRDRGKLVVDILSRLSVCERASVDECYLDVTEEAHKRLAACSGHPPLPVSPQQIHVCGQAGDEAAEAWDLPIPKLRNLGGKFGEEVMRAHGIATVGELVAIPLNRLAEVHGESAARWLSHMAQGFDADEVKQRTLPKSIGCSKTFRGGSALKSLDGVHRWLKELAHELEERIKADRAANARIPRLLTVSVWFAAPGGEPTTAANWQGNSGLSRSCQLRRPEAAAMAEDALLLVKKCVAEQHAWAIVSLGLSASNCVAAPTGSSTITRFLKPATQAAPQAAPLSPQHPPDHAGGLAAIHLPAQRSGGQEPAMPAASCVQHEAMRIGGDAGDQRFSGTMLAEPVKGREPSHRKEPSRASHDVGVDAPLLLHYHADELDAAVLAELPPEIQREVRLALMASRPEGGSKKGHMSAGKGPAPQAVPTVGSLKGPTAAKRQKLGRTHTSQRGALDRFLGKQ